jgi:hypothetical protein
VKKLFGVLAILTISASYAHCDAIEAARAAHAECIAQSTHQLDIAQKNMTEIPALQDIKDYINKDKITVEDYERLLSVVLRKIRIRHTNICNYINVTKLDSLTKDAYRELYWYYVGCQETLEDISDMLVNIDP